MDKVAGRMTAVLAAVVMAVGQSRAETHVDATAASRCSGPVAHWPLDDATGNVVQDLAGGDNHGRLPTGATASGAPGLIGTGALRFTAGHQQVTGPDKGLPAGSSPGSICLWFQCPDGVSNKVLFVYGSPQFGQARGLWLRNHRTLCFFFRGHPADLNAIIPGGITPHCWHYVVATYDGKTARLYYDGEPAATGDADINTRLRGTFHIGTNLDEHSRDFLGQIDDVAVFDRVLSSDEIRDTYARHADTVRRLQKQQRARILARVDRCGVGEVIFAVRQPGKDGHWYANFGYWATDPGRTLYGEGGRLCRLDVHSGRLQILLDDPQGGVRDPQVHYDGRKILFSYRKGGQPYYHLYEIRADGTGLRQLTDGPYDDFEPTYLPDGDIIFCSSRCRRWVPCWSTQVAVLHRCDADGKQIRMISSNIEQENTPCVLPDGRILYTRWEYVDRSQVDYHHLWTVNPDGTGQMIYYGNQHPGTVMIDALPIPGTRKVVASFSPGHGRTEHAGAITVVDPAGGPDQTQFARRLGQGNDFRDPYPLAEDGFLVARGGSILLLDARGATAPLYSLPEADAAAGLACHEPRPLQPRPRERIIPSRIDRSRPTGRLILADVNYGRNMPGVERGQIKKLLVLESLPEPINFNGAYPYEISWMEPVTFGGTFALVRVLGTVPVEPDGSAHFEVPAMRSLFFVALDENELSVKRMQSFVTVQPGETTSCSGCHEPRTNTPPPAGALLATGRPPSRIEPIAGASDVPDFPRDIQPILDEHCIECHRPGDRRGDVDLTGDRSPSYSQSYLTMIKRRLITDGRNKAGNRPPRTIGSSASPLMELIDRRHHDVLLAPQQRRQVIAWIESGAPYAGTYAAYFSGMVRVRFPVTAMTRRCGRCHAVEPRQHRRLAWEGYDTRPWTVLPLEFGDEGPASTLCNLTRPEKSALLLAPLSREVGGHGICRSDGPSTPAVFSDRTDPDYRVMLSAIIDAKDRLDEQGRFDMPGYCPNEHYVREMKRYGILPAGHDPSTPIDPYATDRAYWRLMWYRPEVSPEAAIR